MLDEDYSLNPISGKFDKTTREKLTPTAIGFADTNGFTTEDSTNLNYNSSTKQTTVGKIIETTVVKQAPTYGTDIWLDGHVDSWTQSGSGTPDNWNFTGTLGVDGTVTQVGGYTGTYAAEYDNTTGVFWGPWQNIGGLTPADNYQVTLAHNGDASMYCVIADADIGALANAYNFTGASAGTYTPIVGPPSADQIYTITNALSWAVSTVGGGSPNIPVAASGHFVPIFFNQTAGKFFTIDDVTVKKNGIGANVVVNPGFENWSGFTYTLNLYDVITSGALTTQTLTRETVLYHDSPYAIKITLDAANSQNGYSVGQNHTALTPGDFYSFRFWTRAGVADAATSQVNYLILNDTPGAATEVWEWLNQNWVPFPGFNSLTSTEYVTENLSNAGYSGFVSALFTVPASGKIYPLVNATANSNGAHNIYLDTFALVHVTPSAAAKLYELKNASLVSNLTASDRVLTAESDDGTSELFGVVPGGKMKLYPGWNMDTSDFYVRVKDAVISTDALPLGQAQTLFIEDPGANGLIARTSTTTTVARTITAGSSKISVTNGNGVSGQPTIDAVEANFNINSIGGTPLAIGNGGTNTISFNGDATLAGLTYFDGTRLSSNSNLVYNPSTNKLTLASGGSLVLAGGTTSGQGNVQMGAAPSGAWDSNILYLNSTAGTMGIIGGPTPAFGSGDPFFAFRGTTYNAIGNQRGNISIYAGSPAAPGILEGVIAFGTGATLTRLVVNNNGNIGMGASVTAGALTGSILLVDSVNARVGVGIIVPTQKFHVLNSTTSFSVYGQSAYAGTSTDEFNNAQAANYGEYIATTTGYVIGQAGYASGGNRSYGGMFRAIIDKASATNLGVAGYALNAGASGVQIGGYFGLLNASPTFTSAALICDNGSQTDPIFIGKDNGITVFAIKDGGIVTIGIPDSMTIHGALVSSQIEMNSDIQAIEEIHTHSNTSTAAAIYYGARSRGTTATPLIVQNGDYVRIDSAVAYDGVDYEAVGYAAWTVGGVPGSNDMPGKYIIAVTPDGGFTPVEALNIANTGVATFAQTISGSITGNAATVTTNANLTGVITSIGNATSIASQTGTGTKFVVDNTPTLITPVLGAFTSTTGLVGSNANFTDFSGAQMVASQADTGITAQTTLTGIVGEAVSSASIASIGVWGIAQLTGTHNGIGVQGTGQVITSGDTGISAGSYFSANNLHAGGMNVAVYADAANGATNYSFYGNTGTFFNAGGMQFGTYTGGAAVTSTGYITIVDAGGTTRKLMVQA